MGTVPLDHQIIGNGSFGPSVSRAKYEGQHLQPDSNGLISLPGGRCRPSFSAFQKWVKGTVLDNPKVGQRNRPR